MSTKYPYLDIAISVLADNNQPVNYSFNSAPTIALPSLSDLARHFVNLSDGYVMWKVGGRRAFTYFQLNNEGTVTQLAVTVRMDTDILLPGRPIVNLLGTIRRTVTDGARLTHETIVRALSDSGFPENPLRTEAESDQQDAATGLCCRTYISGTELANIMAFPRQEDYAPYQGVIVVPATVSMQPDSSIPVITNPIDKALMVVCPEEAKASAYRVELSDHLTVTYNMAGFDPQSVEFEVGTTNRYVRINGPALVVNSARHAGIVFSRSVPYSVKSATGNDIDTYTILVNGRTATRNENSFELTNTDFSTTADGKVTISVSSTNFGSYSREFTPEELSEAMPLDIVLEPEARKVSLRLDFGGGRILEDSITLEKSTPEYNRLRAGNFHGFRAHRLMGSTPETYNIDLKCQAQPAQPSLNFSQPASAPLAKEPVSDNEKARDEQPAAETEKPETSRTPRQPLRHNGPVAPVIEKAPSAVWEEKQSRRVAPKFENVTGDRKQDKKRKKTADELPTVEKAEEPQAETKEKESKLDMRLIIIGISVIAVALIVWWLMLLFSGNGSSDADNGDMAADSVEQVNYTDAAGQPAAAAPVQAAPVAATSDAEKADVQYLNDNTTWNIADLKSDKYRALINAMQQGDIDAVASNHYFSVAGTATNKKAVQVVTYLWKAKGTPQMKGNVKILTKLTKDGKANLGQLIDDLSRLQPTEPNAEPMPAAK